MELAYGRQRLTDFLPSGLKDRVLSFSPPEKGDVVSDIPRALKSALQEPVGYMEPFLKAFPKGGRITIVVDDYTRPNIHTRMLMPALLEQLDDLLGGVDRVTILMATGLHRPPSGKGDWRFVLGDEAFETLSGRARLVAHDAHDRSRLVKAAEVDGAGLFAAPELFDSDGVLMLSDIEYHYFAGIAGGPKMLCPGVVDADTVLRSHRSMLIETGEDLHPNVEMGVLDGNPVYEYNRRCAQVLAGVLREQGKPVYLLSAVIDHVGDLVHLSVGDVITCHKIAAEALKKVSTVSLTERPDVLVLGSSDRGINMLQAAKNLHFAPMVVKKGGRVILAAPCPEGFGNDAFRENMRPVHDVLGRCKTPEDVNAHIADARKAAGAAAVRDYQVGSHKFADILRTLEWTGAGNIIVMSEPYSGEELLPFEHVHPEGDQALCLKGLLENEIEKNPDASFMFLDDPNFLFTKADDS